MGFLGLVKGLHVMALDALSANAPRPTPLSRTSRYRRAVPAAERLPIVPATRGLRKNLGGPSSRMPAAFTGTGGVERRRRPSHILGSRTF
jgi:hypothetical protein